jgi:hypothetical protein
MLLCDLQWTNGDAVGVAKPLTRLRSKRWKSFDVKTLDCARKSLASRHASRSSSGDFRASRGAPQES